MTVSGVSHDQHRVNDFDDSLINIVPRSEIFQGARQSAEIDSSNEDEKSIEAEKTATSTSSLSDRKIPPLSTVKPPQSHFTDLFTPSKKRLLHADLDSVATQPSVFDDDEYGKHSMPHPQWENLHRFDPLFRWTWRSERKLVRKMDWLIALWACIMFFGMDLDRMNISQANSDGFLTDLGLTKDDYNLGNTLFKLAFLLAELPSQMISKRIGPDVWVPMQMCMWSIFSGAQFWLSGRASFLAFRWMIGMISGGFIPDIVLWLSYFYTREELPLRLAFFWVSNYLVNIVSPFLAIGLLKLRGVNGHAGWRYLFLIEGILTLIIGILSFVQMPAGPTQTKNWLYRKGWFSEEEEKIIVNRAIRDDPSKGSMHNRQGIDWIGFKKSLGDYDMWPLYGLGLIFLIPSYPVANYLTLELKSFGFSTEATNALSIPAPALGLLFLIVITIISERVKNRSFVAMSMSVWNAVFYFALFGLPADAGKWTKWTILSLQQAYPYVHALQVAWVSRQSGSVRTRTISAAIYNMFVQVSAIIGANVYQSSDAPLYRKGNLAMAILATFCCGVYVAIFFYYRSRNRSRDQRWSAMSREEQLHYLATTTDEGNRRLDFRFAT